MRVFVTGGSGHIGWAVVPELVRGGHEVVCLARSEAAATTVKSLGAQVRRGGVDDLDGLRAAAADADGVIHLAFNHEGMRTGDLAGAAAEDLSVVRAFAEALAGTGKALIGIGMTASGDPDADATLNANPRSAVARELAGFSAQGMRSMLVAVPPVVHSPRDRGGFIPTLISIARATGVSGYLGEGAARWPAAHALDLGALYRLALEQAPAGSQLFGATEEGIRVREIAEAIGRHLGIPTRSFAPDQAVAQFGPFGRIMTMIDFTMPNASTRELLDWKPTHPGLLADLDEGHYFTTG